MSKSNNKPKFLKPDRCLIRAVRGSEYQLQQLLINSTEYKQWKQGKGPYDIVCIVGDSYTKTALENLVKLGVTEQEFNLFHDGLSGAPLDDLDKWRDDRGRVLVNDLIQEIKSTASELERSEIREIFIKTIVTGIQKNNQFDDKDLPVIRKIKRVIQPNNVKEETQSQVLESKRKPKKASNIIAAYFTYYLLVEAGVKYGQVDNTIIAKILRIYKGNTLDVKLGGSNEYKALGRMFNEEDEEKTRKHLEFVAELFEDLGLDSVAERVRRDME